MRMPRRMIYGVAFCAMLAPDALCAMPLRILTSGPNPPTRYYIIDKIDWDRILGEMGGREIRAIQKVFASNAYGWFAIRTIRPVNPRHNYMVFPVCGTQQKAGEPASGSQGEVTIRCQ
jgi:hypothetical protein